MSTTLSIAERERIRPLPAGVAGRLAGAADNRGRARTGRRVREARALHARRMDPGTAARPVRPRNPCTARATRSRARRVDRAGQGGAGVRTSTWRRAASDILGVSGAALVPRRKFRRLKYGNLKERMRLPYFSARTKARRGDHDLVDARAAFPLHPPCGYASSWKPCNHLQFCDRIVAGLHNG